MDRPKLRHSAVFISLSLTCFVAQSASEEKAPDNPPLMLKRAWEIFPYVSLGQTLTDNALLDDKAKTSDLVLSISPGIRVHGETHFFKGTLDYSRNQTVSTEDSRRNSGQNYLDAKGSFEAIEKHLFIDASAKIVQQTISALGTQSVANATANPNQTETLSLQISPFIKGLISDQVSYEARARTTTTQTKANLTSDMDNHDFSLTLRSAVPFYGIDWSLQTETSKSSYSSGFHRASDTLRADFSYRMSRQLLLRSAIGSESNDYLSDEKATYGNYNVGFDWSFTEHSKLSLTKGHEYFGESHAFNLEHRTPLSLWRYYDSRSVSELPSQLNSNNLNSVYDQFFTVFATLEPDPVKRAQLVNAYLAANGMSSTTLINSGFLSSALSVMHHQELSVAIVGARNTLNASIQRQQSERIGKGPGIDDTFTQSSRIEQKGFTVTLAHRLSGNTTFTSYYLSNRTTGVQTSQKSKFSSLNMGITTRLGARTSGSLNFKHTTFDRTINAYTENSVIGSVSMQY